MQTKKASLSLSMNAIVVLILAITMLGLAMGFIKTMFGRVSGQVEAIVANEPEPRPASAAEPLVLSRETIVLRPSETTAIKYSVYNSGASAFASNNILNNPALAGAGTSCIVSDTTDVTHPLILKSQIPKQVNPSSSVNSLAILQAGGVTGQLACQICTVSTAPLTGACADVTVVIK